MKFFDLFRKIFYKHSGNQDQPEQWSAEEERSVLDCESPADSLPKAKGVDVAAAFEQSPVLPTASRRLGQQENAALNIKFALYDHPLYAAVPNEHQSIHVMVLGLDKYASTFLDTCLQLAQDLMPADGNASKKLLASVVCQEAQILDYQSSRYALSDFFDVQDSSDDPTSYGQIRFGVADSFSPEALAEKLLEYEEIPHYVFISLGDDLLNKTVADAYANLGFDGHILYVQETLNQSDTSGATALHVNQNALEDSGRQQLVNMGYNVHLAWQKTLCVPHAKLSKQYRQHYNFHSCMNFVLSIPYKLHSVGIDMLTLGTAAAAAACQNILSSDEAGELTDQLAWREHRRWVVEKICNGYRKMAITQFSGSTKDTRRKLHMCLAKSDCKRRLSAADCPYWDDRSAPQDELDALDHVSVSIHRYYAEQAKAVDWRDLMEGASGAKLRCLVENDKACENAFREWSRSMYNISGKDGQQYIGGYELIYQTFLNSLANLGAASERAEELTRQIADAFTPTCKKNTYWDFKKDDETLICHIPFILTYHLNTCMVIPVATDNRNALFSNIAPALMANPQQLLYLCYVETKEQVYTYSHAIQLAVDYLKKKNIRSRISVQFICPQNTAFAQENYLMNTRDLRKTKGITDRQTIRDVLNIDQSVTPISLPLSGIHSIRVIWKKDPKQAINALFSELKKRNGKTLLYMLEKNDTKCATLLEFAGAYDTLPSYRFDSKRAAFSGSCSCLQYLRKQPHMTVSDMLFMNHATAVEWNNPEFFDNYQDIWSLYCKNRNAWKILCNTYDEHFFGKKLRDRKTVKNLQIFIPQRGKRDQLAEAQTLSKEIEGILSGLHKLRLIGSDWHVALSGATLNICFQCANEQTCDLLSTAGRILEIFVYHHLRQTGLFDDIGSGVKVRWSGDQISNEFDCIVTQGFNSWVIECKACWRLQQDFFYKLSTLNHIFGINSHPVLVADSEFESEQIYVRFDKPENDAQLLRGRQMGITTIQDILFRGQTNRPQASSKIMRLEKLLTNMAK